MLGFETLKVGKSPNRERKVEPFTRRVVTKAQVVQCLIAAATFEPK